MSTLPRRLFAAAAGMISDDYGEKSSTDTYDVVKKGYLYIKRPPSQSHVKIRIKAWQKRFFVLRDHTQDSGTRLEIYSKEQTDLDQSDRKTEKHTISLDEVAFVEQYSQSKSFPHAFTITPKGYGPLIMGTESENEMKEWLVAFKLLTEKDSKQSNSLDRHLFNRRVSNDQLDSFEKRRRVSSSSSGSLDGSPRTRRRTLSERDLNTSGLPVAVQVTDASRRNNVFGEYSMAVTVADIELRQKHTETIVLAWPLLNIRKFKCEQAASGGGDIVTLETGLRCQSGQGTFLFRTHFGKELVWRVREAARRYSLGRKCREQEKQMDLLRLNHNTLAPAANNIERFSSAPNLPNLPESEQVPRPPARNDSAESDIGANSYLQVIPDTDDDAFEGPASPISHTHQEFPAKHTGTPSSRRFGRKDSGYSESSESSSQGSNPGCFTPPPPVPPPRPKHTLTSQSGPVEERRLPPPLPVV